MTTRIVYVRMSAFHRAHHDEDREIETQFILDEKGDESLETFRETYFHYLLASRMKNF